MFRPFRGCSLANAAALFVHPPGASVPERIFPARAKYDVRCFEPEAGNKTATGTVSVGQKRVFFVTFFWQDKRKLVKEITDNKNNEQKIKRNEEQWTKKYS